MVPNNHASGSTEIVGIKPLKLPADYVDQAETIIVGFSSSKKEGCISTSKLRNLMSFTSAIYDQELRRTSNQMSEASLSKPMSAAGTRTRTHLLKKQSFCNISSGLHKTRKTADRKRWILHAIWKHWWLTIAFTIWTRRKRNNVRKTSHPM